MEILSNYFGLNFSNIFKIFCQVVCHVSAIAMGIVLLLRYFRNEDGSKIQYRNFHTNPDDLYPTLSLCINSINHGLGIGNQTPNGTKAFQLFMGNEKAEPMDEYESVDLEALIPKFHFFLKKFYAKNQHSVKIDPWYHPEIYPNGYKSFKKFQYDDLKFYTSYVDPTTICYSWNVDYLSKDIMRNADLYIQLEKLLEVEQLSPDGVFIY